MGANVGAGIDGRHRHTPRAEKWLALADPQSASPAETVARLRMHDAGLHPVSQAELLTPAGRRIRADFLFVREGVAVEIEGFAYHGTREAHRRDLDRFNALSACPGVRLILRFPAATVFRTPDRMLTEIRAALATAARVPGRARRGIRDAQITTIRSPTRLQRPTAPLAPDPYTTDILFTIP
ncbi:endonuclease domain-containing protein [Streptomyces sp. NBC_01012]|uniref:endonuclease domain-containing protein n=1 Tax=Streptomyces sp. NBC_01012 TaxID=2903717 RepID=UPI003863C473